MKTNFLRLCLAVLILQFAYSSLGQSPWTATTFRFSKDTGSLVNMTGATPVIYSGTQPITSGLLNFPSGFTFHYGLKTYSNFSVCKYGFARLGNDIANNNPDLQDEVIVPIYNTTNWTLGSYLLTGASPNRKFIIQWDGVMQPTGQQTKFQVWLSERTGKIEIVYQSLDGLYGYSSFWDYKIYCRTSILQQSTIAALKINPNNALPTISYSTILLSHDSISARTRFILQPDTIKPATPTPLTFSNIQAGCLTVQIADNSTNESLFQLERSDDNTTFFTETKIYSSNPPATGPLLYNQTKLQPFWNYKYRVFASNGFWNSDTVTNTVQTLMPQINGIKQIPGDYPSVTALLQDAACKHLGPDLVIELKNTYIFANETLPVAFGKTLQNRFINSIVIRPAIGATINWEANTNNAILYVDSLKHLFIDGRPGGIGNNRNFTIKQNNPLKYVVHILNSADSGGLRYCNIISKPYASNDDIHSVQVDSRDSSFVKRTGVNSFSLSNCYLASDGAASSNLLHLESEDTVSNQNFVITNNEFNRFSTNAILVESGGKNGIITGNHFYQTEPFTTHGNFSTGSSCIKLLNTENISIVDNYFGGGDPIWGQGSFVVDQTSSDIFSFIYYENTTPYKRLTVNNNKFGNIYTRNNDWTRLVFVTKGGLSFTNNIIGTVDSVFSLKSDGLLTLVDVTLGQTVVTNNFFSGIHSGGTAFVHTFMGDTLTVKNNDFGGKDAINQNTSVSGMYGILGFSQDSIVTFTSNLFRGWTSSHSIHAISKNPGIGSEKHIKLVVDSNNIHSLHSKGRIWAMDLTTGKSKTINRISNNQIYSLSSTGENTSGGTPAGWLRGIYAGIVDDDTAINPQCELQIYGNRIHSFKTSRTPTTNLFAIDGIIVGSTNTKIWNNDIRLGLDPLGLQNDSTSAMSAISGSALNNLLIEHNSIFLGGKGFRSYGITVPVQSGTIPNNIITNNIIEIDRINMNPTVPHEFIKMDAASNVSAKNIWYATNDSANVSSLLQSFKQSCNCDQTSFVANPRFINPTGDSVSYNLGLNTGSAADSTGTPSLLTIPTDINGLNRSNHSPVDIGSHAATPCATGTAPQITITTPVADTVRICPGNTVTLNASISGGSFQTLQWQKNMGNISGATGTSYTANSGGIYRLVGKNPCMLVASRSIFVILNTSNVSPSVTIFTANTTVCAGATVNFTANASNQGTAPVYQWQVNGINVGTNSPAFSSSSLTNNSQVKVIVTNTTTCSATPTATSSIITMTVNPMVIASITIAGNTTIIAGQSTTLTATPVNGGPNPSYQWQDSTTTHNWQNIAGAFNPTLVYNPISTGNKVRCNMISSANCLINSTTVFSNVLVFTVNTVTAINPVNGSNYGIRYYPNPVNTVLFIDSLKLSDKWQTLEIKSIDGKSVVPVISIANRTTTSVNVGRLPGCLYIAVLRKKNGIPAYLKFIKQ